MLPKENIPAHGQFALGRAWAVLIGACVSRFAAVPYPLIRQAARSARVVAKMMRHERTYREWQSRPI